MLQCFTFSQLPNKNRKMLNYTYLSIENITIFGKITILE